MSTFAALMALSVSQTKQSDAQVEKALIERQRKEVQKRKAQEERERKERELEARIRQKHFEDQRREEERQRRQEELRKQKDAERQRREEAQRDALRYGPKKAKADGGGHASSSYPSRDTARRRSSGHDSDGGGVSAAMALTREEKRQRKLESELRRGSSAPRRTTHAGYQKAGRRLPGGAVDHIRTSTGPQSDELEMSVKERLLRAPPDLIKLNQIKRDTRTIDEILQDRAKSAQKKVLSGDAAREFSDWFGKGKAAEKKAASISPSRSATPAHAPSSLPKSSPNGSASPLSASTKAKSLAFPAAPSAPKSTLPSFSKSVTATSKPVPPAERKGSTSGVTVKSTPVARNNTGITAVAGKPTPAKPAPPVRQSSSVALSVKKRARSSSMSSLSPPPSKKRPQQTELSSQIWKIFGKDRDAYTQQDVLSDDEDMEADAMDLEQEELRSARIARKEEEAALEEERRHEEEKRRKKKEKEMRERGLRA